MPALAARLRAERQAEIEDVGEARGVLAGDAVAIGRLGHRLRAASTVAGANTSWRAARPRPAGAAQHDGAKGQIGVRRRRARRARARATRAVAHRAASAAAASGAQSSTMPRLVFGADGGARRLDRAEDARADARAGARERRGRRLGAAHEIVDRHAVAGGEDVDVAGLRRLEFVAAGADERARRSASATRRHAMAPRRARAASAADEIVARGPPRC